MTEALPTPEPKPEAKPTAYVEKLVIDGFRGMQTTIEGFAPLTILVGRNGTRKSTVLEALSIAAADDFPHAVADAILRRRFVENAARWLFPRGEVATGASVSVAVDGARSKRSVTLRLVLESVAAKELRAEGHVPVSSLDLSATHLHPVLGNGVVVGSVAMAAAGSIIRAVSDAGASPLGFDAALMQPGPTSPSEITDLYTRLKTVGRHRAANRVLRVLAERGAEQGAELDIGTDGGRPFLMLLQGDRGVPVAAAGDGARELIECSLHYLEKDRGIQLHEEPETHLHPGAIREMARVIADAVKRGVQVVLTTHSLELIDALLSFMHDALEHVAIFQTALDRGQLQTSRFTGTEAQEMRGALGEDLR